MIKLYTVKGCPACENARRYLDGLGVKYKEIDVNDDPDRVRELSGGSRIQIPIICSGKKCEIGFDEKAFEKIIKKE